MSGGGSDEVRGIGGGGRRTEAQAPAVGLTAAVGPHCRRLDGGTHCGLVLHVPRVAWSVCLSVCLFVLYTETQAPAVGLSTAVGPHCRRLDGGTHCGLVLHVPHVAWSLCLSVCLVHSYSSTCCGTLYSSGTSLSLTGWRYALRPSATCAARSVVCVFVTIVTPCRYGRNDRERGPKGPRV